VVNRFVKKNCFIRVRFQVAEASYSVIRYCRHKKYQNALRLFRNGKPIHSRHKDITQKLLEDILGMDFQAIINSMIFVESVPYALKSDADQKKVLESFLRFGQFDAALKRTKKRISKVKEEYQSILLKVTEQKGDIKALRDSISAVRKVQCASRKITTKKLQKLKRKYRSLLAQKPVFKNPVSEPDLKSREKILSRLDWKLETFSERIAKLIESIDNQERDLHNRKKFIGRACPFCGIIISGKSLMSVEAHLQTEITKARKELSEKEFRRAELERRITYGRKSLNRLQEKLAFQSTRLRNWHKLQETMAGRVLAGKDSLKSALPAIDIDKLSHQFSGKLKQLICYEQQLRKLNSLLEKLCFWEIGFGNKGIKSQVLREILPGLNAKIKELADEIFQGAVRIEFVPTRQTKKGEERDLFHVKYEAKRGSASYLGESRGGRRRVDVCILLCFAWLARSSNILFVDELLDSVDESGREAILLHLSLLRGTVLVITHRQDIRAEIGQVWTVIKENGFSRLEIPS
jgi:hypothetical protein